LATTRDQAKRIAVTKDSRVLDVGCGRRGTSRIRAAVGSTASPRVFLGLEGSPKSERARQAS
jgi:hypothetical protein